MRLVDIIEKSSLLVDTVIQLTGLNFDDRDIRIRSITSDFSSLETQTAYGEEASTTRLRLVILLGCSGAIIQQVLLTIKFNTAEVAVKMSIAQVLGNDEQNNNFYGFKHTSIASSRLGPELST